MCLSTLFCANDGGSFLNLRFENDVKTYGTETNHISYIPKTMFENDVKTYGTETARAVKDTQEQFENDVKTYGTETESHLLPYIPGLRMM